MRKKPENRVEALPFFLEPLPLLLGDQALVSETASPTYSCCTLSLTLPYLRQAYAGAGWPVVKRLAFHRDGLQFEVRPAQQ
jgi:hypothetical protein